LILIRCKSVTFRLILANNRWLYLFAFAQVTA